MDDEHPMALRRMVGRGVVEEKDLDQTAPSPDPASLLRPRPAHSPGIDFCNGICVYRSRAQGVRADQRYFLLQPQIHHAMDTVARIRRQKEYSVDCECKM
ncbi:hypothetical protein FVE85_5934 [Porphyridium purpureum]|uniref:Uncharacterized protein n=1 Tax=Porphyridium purpureum TaxID=35688 RepID=A0A5J4Z303_PORPP|nr:hypothetical protein FVE85_5934 [Porphyridium purpureum]|eukprot:POR7909..scf295_1